MEENKEETQTVKVVLSSGMTIKVVMTKERLRNLIQIAFEEETVNETIDIQSFNAKRKEGAVCELRKEAIDAIFTMDKEQVQVEQRQLIDVPKGLRSKFSRG